MAKTPPVSAIEGEGSIQGRHTNPACKPRLTLLAEQYAASHALHKAIAGAALRPEMSVGDTLTIEEGGRRHDFAIVARRWIASEGGAALELTLDHPPRRGF